VWLSLAAPGELIFKKDTVDGQVLRAADVQGCSLAEPRKARKGHEHALRVDTARDDAKGGKKYILSVKRGMSVQAVAKQLQKKEGWKNEPVMTADAQILDPRAGVGDVGAVRWEVMRSNLGSSVAEWKPDLSLWQKHPILSWEVQT